MKLCKDVVFRWFLSGMMVLIFLSFFQLFRHHSSSPHQAIDHSGMTIAQMHNKLHLRRNMTLVLWSSDFHISPVADVKNMLSEVGVKIIDKSLSGHCRLSHTCAKDLRVLSRENGINLNPCANDIRRKFYEEYRNDPEFLQADAFLCQHAAALCELFMPFGKPIIVIASTRYEIGRHSKSEWQRWNQNLELLASKWYNTIAANNLYDLEYLRYFTSLSTEKSFLLPNYCDYVHATYNPLKSEILLAPARGIHPDLVSELQQELKKYNSIMEHRVVGEHNLGVLKIVPIRELYPGHYEYNDLAQHRAMVVLPYQVSIMSLFEWYRMGIPLYVPSPELLATWHVEKGVLSERTWDSVHLGRQQKPRHHSEIDGGKRFSPLPRNPMSSSMLHSDPNDEVSKSAVLEWIKLSDFYQWPHITQFNSWQELFELVHPSYSNHNTMKFTSLKMQAYNKEEKDKIFQSWMGILQRIQQFKQFGENGAGSLFNMFHHSEELPEDINDALEKHYGYHLIENSCDEQSNSTLFWDH